MIHVISKNSKNHNHRISKRMMDSANSKIIWEEFINTVYIEL